MTTPRPMDFTISCSIILFAILALVPILSTGQTYHNVTLGSSIAANGDNSTWISPSGDFAFGFQVVPGGYLLAIWFNKIPERTIVWSANRDNPTEEGSTVQLFLDGRFELNDRSGRRIWNANSAIRHAVTYGAMLDSGNFVLKASNSSEIMWQSFDEPTDTLLPGQTLNPGRGLVSSISETNYSRGRFAYDMQDDGNFVLYTRNFPMDDRIYAYVDSNTFYYASFPGGTGLQVTFNQSGYIFLRTTKGTLMLSSRAPPTTKLYHRAILEYDGIFRHYVYNSTSRWSVWEFWPINICTTIQGETGPGACGFNSYCSIGTDQRPNCSCPDRYSLLDPNDRLSGCKPNFIQQSCDQELGEADHFRLIDMPNTNFPSSSIDYEILKGVDEDQCRQACLVDCFCVLAAHHDNICWKKRYPLSNGRADPIINEKSMIKVRINNTIMNTSTSTSCIQQKKRDQTTLIITGSVSLGSSLFLNLLLMSLVLFFACCFNKRNTYAVFPGLTIRSFSFAELQEATSEFNEQLGSGASSTVYKGVLKYENGKLIAVKKLSEIAPEIEKEFKAEVNSISSTNHKNLVRLLGYCDEGRNKLLVYEFMRNGSLSSFLFGNSRPQWHTRAQIALATASGICYLHEECSTQIIHCDIKPQNILLDESLNAKVSDFGLAKLLRPDETRTTTGIRGTRGYVAPEWFRRTPITVKVDVYSFGILLLELICCRRNVTKDEDERKEILAYWAYDCYKEGRVDLLVDDDKEAIKDIKKFEKFVMIAIWCIQEDPSARPSMKMVLCMLEGSLEVPIPPHPESDIY